jgi:hypothetical protein
MCIPNTAGMVQSVSAFLIFYTVVPGNLHELLVGVLGVDRLPDPDPYL